MYVKVPIIKMKSFDPLWVPLFMLMIWENGDEKLRKVLMKSRENYEKFCVWKGSGTWKLIQLVVVSEHDI